MRTGDEVGTYRVSTSSPGTGWTDRGTFFRDSVYNNSQINDYRLWLRLSATPPAGTTVLPLLITNAGDIQQQSQASNSAFANFLYQLLVSRLSSNDLTYNIDGGGINRGTFIDTRRSSTATNRNQINQNDYRTTVTPSGGAVTFRTYNFRMN